MSQPNERELPSPDDVNPPFSTAAPVRQESAVVVAGFGARLIAYLLDVLPITLAVAAFFYYFLGFDETVRRYFAASGDIDVRRAFLKERNQVRDLSFVIYMLYCAVTEGSPLQATIGKLMVGLRVTDSSGNPLSPGKAFTRNLAKIVSYIPLGLGFLWALWSKKRQGWHDLIAGTLVVKSPGRKRFQEPNGT